MNNLDKFLKGWAPKVVCEVGVFSWSCSQSKNFVDIAKQILLVEPNSLFSREFARINSTDKTQLILFPVCITEERQRVKFYNRNKNSGKSDASAFIELINNPPAIVNDRYTPSSNHFTIEEGYPFNLIDPGNIDLLLVDIEGAEWFVLKNLISRPKFISVETHGLQYVNPYIDEIKNWMNKNNYLEIGKDIADTLYKLKE